MSIELPEGLPAGFSAAQQADSMNVLAAFLIGMIALGGFLEGLKYYEEGTMKKELWRRNYEEGTLEQKS